MFRTQMAGPEWSEWAGGRAAAVIRAVSPADLDALRIFFSGLSPQTRYLRFFGPVTPGPALLRLLAGDHGDGGGDGGGGGTDAVIALRGGLVIGHAMATDGTGPRGARMTEIGVVVADAWQGRGVGSALVRALISGAQERGVTAVAMDVLPANRRVLAMITRHWPAARISRSPDCLTVWLRLPHHQQPRGLPGLAARPHMSHDRLGQAMASCQERQGSGGAGSLPA